MTARQADQTVDQVQVWLPEVESQKCPDNVFGSVRCGRDAQIRRKDAPRQEERGGGAALVQNVFSDVDGVGTSSLMRRWRN